MASDRGIDFDNKTQWGPGHAPIRIGFGNLVDGRSDCAWTLPPKLIETVSPVQRKAYQDQVALADAAYKAGKRHISHGINLKCGWDRAAALFEMFEERNIEPYADHEGQWIVSGYRLHAAGILDDEGEVVATLSTEQKKKLFGTAEPVAQDYLCYVLGVYAEFLSLCILNAVTSVPSTIIDSLAHPSRGTEEEIDNFNLLIRLAIWRREVIEVMSALGQDVPSPTCCSIDFVTDDMPAKRRELADRFRKMLHDVLMEAGLIVETLDLKDAPVEIHEQLSKLREQSGTQYTPRTCPVAAPLRAVGENEKKQRASKSNGQKSGCRRTQIKDGSNQG